MYRNIPGWAVRSATAGDRQRAASARTRDVLRITWPDKKALKAWTKKQGWPTPWLGFDGVFIEKMLESDETFALALRESGVELAIPTERFSVPQEHLKEFDELYDRTDETGRPTDWGILVAELRDIRRAVEAGVIVEVDGRELKSFSTFYDWAHGRYHALEDGYDSWIGDDKS